MAVILRSSALLSGAGIPTGGFTSLWWAPGTVGGSTADATDVLARFRTAWVAMAARMSDQISVDFDPICIAVEATTGALTGAFAGTDPLTVPGTNIGQSLPYQTQGLVRLATSTIVAGRRLRGRLFIPGPTESDNEVTGTPSAAYTSLLTSAFATILTAGATTSIPVIWHRPTAGAGGASAAITGVSGTSTWTVLRSRRS